jgi:hypothetical protein
MIMIIVRQDYICWPRKSQSSDFGPSYSVFIPIEKGYRDRPKPLVPPSPVFILNVHFQPLNPMDGKLPILVLCFISDTNRGSETCVRFPMGYLYISSVKYIWSSGGGPYFLLISLICTVFRSLFGKRVLKESMDGEKVTFQLKSHLSSPEKSPFSALYAPCHRPPPWSLEEKVS